MQLHGILQTSPVSRHLPLVPCLRTNCLCLVSLFVSLVLVSPPPLCRVKKLFCFSSVGWWGFRFVGILLRGVGFGRPGFQGGGPATDVEQRWQEAAAALGPADRQVRRVVLC